jgi:hypothetical protein
VHLWLERYVLPICATVVFGLTILNPLKLDWQQRISMAIAITAIAYFIGHTLRKPATPSIQQDQRIMFLEQQLQSVQSQQRQLADQEASKEKQRQQRQEVRKQLAVFIEEGEKIQKDLEFNNSTALQAKIHWQQRVVDYLTKNLDESYAVRFRNPSHQVTSYPAGIAGQGRGMMVPWAEVTVRMVMLNDFISELRD